LASTAVIDNPLDGSVEAEITVPREEDEFTQARTKARSSRFSEFSMLLGTVMLLVGAILYAIDVHNSRFDNSTAHSELWFPRREAIMVEDMAIDVVSACTSSSDASSPQGFFVGLSLVFALYIGLDTVIAAMVVRRKLRERNTTPEVQATPVSKQ
jgi:hypothetical protein